MGAPELEDEASYRYAVSALAMHALLGRHGAGVNGSALRQVATVAVSAADALIEALHAAPLVPAPPPSPSSPPATTQ